MSWIAVDVDGRIRRVAAARGRAGIWISLDGRTTFHPDPKRHSTGAGSVAAADEIRAPMTGKVIAVQVQVDDDVAEGALLAILEAMKMEYRLVAPRAGRVAAVHSRAGDLVDLGMPLVTLKELSSPIPPLTPSPPPTPSPMPSSTPPPASPSAR